MKYIITQLLILFSIFVSSCSSGQERTSRQLQGVKTLEKGKVNSNVVCVKDPATSYALYLPTTYSAEKKNPVILAFDPQGSGNFPVEKYKDLAEKYGYILLGSNNSKNGQQMNETDNIIFSLFEEIDLRFSIDTSRIYAMGFSGGARIASLIALYRGGIKGVIACGAGFPATGQPGRFRFDYIGMVGNADFNMNELINLDGTLEQSGFRHSLKIFDGKHGWPPVDIMEFAFIWNDLCAMKDGKIPMNTQTIENFTSKIKASLKQDEEQKNLFQQQMDLNQSIHFLQGLKDVEIEKKKFNELISTDAYKKEEKRLNAMKEKEMQEQQMLSEDFYLKDINWWRKRITDYGLRITSGKDQNDVLMYKRIKSYLSLLCYMNYSRASSQNQKEKVDFSLQVYRMVDPENAANFK